MLRVYLIVLPAIAVLFAAALPMVLAEDKQPAPQAKPDAVAADELDTTSYTLGYVLSHRLAEAGIEVNEESFIRGFRAAYGQEKPAMSQEEMKQTLEALLAQLREAEAEDESEGAVSKRAQEAERRRQAAQQGVGEGQPSDGVYLRIDGQVPPDRVDTAVEATRRATFEADNPEANR